MKAEEKLHKILFFEFKHHPSNVLLLPCLCTVAIAIAGITGTLNRQSRPQAKHPRLLSRPNPSHPQTRASPIPQRSHPSRPPPSKAAGPTTNFMAHKAPKMLLDARGKKGPLAMYIVSD